ncbi:hypothetical protein M885DRAFT_504842 [Pelagophyceae sp. CCMP2097]|nr:hypothetical protein M885DRAFT_504842 [Pelagophyceae sp. CCMP2097]|mmetsp:Transcript_8748/g.28777  ORF Transcript_8748/g.28777 Transcript_8748/m.28777 type:complete len:370 (+) Transcript_8748:130-1239(+)
MAVAAVAFPVAAGDALAKRRSAHALVQAHTLYRLSCATYAVWGLLVLVFHRPYMIETYGPGIDVMAVLSLVQSAFAYAGDVACMAPEPPLYLRRALWQSLFLPDIGLALFLFVWACRLFRSCAAWWACLVFSAAAFNVALYQNHRRGKASWLHWHVLWHALPVSSYLVLTPPAAFGLDRCMLWSLVWTAILLHFGPRKFGKAHGFHDAHAVIACAVVLCGLGVVDTSFAVLSFSCGYFVADFVTCVAANDFAFAVHAFSALALILANLRQPDAVRRLGAQVLLVELSTPLMHAWQRRRTAASLLAFTASFGATRIVFLPHLTRRLLLAADSPVRWVLVPLNVLQFGWFAHLVVVVCRRALPPTPQAAKL